MITKEDFDAWRDNHVTEAVFAALSKLSDQSKKRWMDVSWTGGSADPLVLADLRARSEIINDLREITFEELEAMNDEPKRDKSDRV